MISKFPLFAFHFELMRILSDRLHQAEELLQHVSSMHLQEELSSEGIGLGDISCDTKKLKLQPPCPPCCDWRCISEGPDSMPRSTVSQTFAKWQALWALEMLLG